MKPEREISKAKDSSDSILTVKVLAWLNLIGGVVAGTAIGLQGANARNDPAIIAGIAIPIGSLFMSVLMFAFCGLASNVQTIARNSEITARAAIRNREVEFKETEGQS